MILIGRQAILDHINRNGNPDTPRMSMVTLDKLRKNKAIKFPQKKLGREICSTTEQVDAYFNQLCG
jgi:hypothetical protein